MKARGEIAVTVAALFAGTAAQAGPLVIAPTTVTIEPGRRSAVVTVENASDAPVDLQFRAYRWSQPSGEDKLDPADDLLVSPAIATVPARGKQMFRVLQVAVPPAAGTGERAWRLRLNELPRADATAVAINLEFLLPVFQGEADAKPRLSWTREPDGRVTVTNAGARHARLSRLALAGTDPGGAPLLIGSPYLLSGASRTFAPPALSNYGARLIAEGDTGPIDAEPVALAAR